MEQSSSFIPTHLPYSQPDMEHQDLNSLLEPRLVRIDEAGSTRDITGSTATCSAGICSMGTNSPFDDQLIPSLGSGAFVVKGSRNNLHGSPQSTTATFLPGDMEDSAETLRNVSLSADPLTSFDASLSTMYRPPLGPRGPIAIDLSLLDAALDAMADLCELESSKPYLPIVALYRERLAIANAPDPAGLKRFYPVALAPPSVAPGSRVPATEDLTAYHSAIRPHISLRALAETLREGLGFDRIVFAITLVMFDRVREAFATKTSATRTNVGVNAHMMHRLFVACLCIAVKGHEEGRANINTAAFAHACSMMPRELSRLEFNVCADLNWRLSVNSQDAQSLLERLAVTTAI